MAAKRPVSKKAPERGADIGPDRTMGNWKSRKMEKKGKGSQTAGRTKGLNCQASSMERIFAGRSRSYKMRGYSDWLRKTGGK